MAAKADCHAHRPIVVSDPSGYLASLTAAETGCGTSDAPWLIQVMPGQRINVTLFDFSPPDVALHSQVRQQMLLDRFSAACCYKAYRAYATSMASVRPSVRKK